jgi:flagellar biogenesis protein FliO
MPRWPLVLILVAVLPAGAAEPASASAVFTDAEWDRAQPASATGAGVAGPSAGAALTSVALSLVVVVGVAIGLGLLVKRLGVKRLVAGKGRHLEVVETIPVALKRQVALVRFGGQVVLVGIGEHELCHLGTFPAPAGSEPAPAAAVPAEAVPAAPSAFQQVLAGLRRGRP